MSMAVILPQKYTGPTVSLLAGILTDSSKKVIRAVGLNYTTTQLILNAIVRSLTHINTYMKI